MGLHLKLKLLLPQALPLLLGLDVTPVAENGAGLDSFFGLTDVPLSSQVLGRGYIFDVEILDPHEAWLLLLHRRLLNLLFDQ